MKYQKGNFAVVPNIQHLHLLKPASVAVWVALCSFADDQGRCWPSISQLRERSGVSRRAIVNSISELEAKKFLSIQKFAGKGNKYQLLGLNTSAKNAPVQSRSQSDKDTITSQSEKAAPPTLREVCKKCTSADIACDQCKKCTTPVQNLHPNYTKNYTKNYTSVSREREDHTEILKMMIEVTGISHSTLSSKSEQKKLDWLIQEFGEDRVKQLIPDIPILNSSRYQHKPIQSFGFLAHVFEEAEQFISQHKIL